MSQRKSLRLQTKKISNKQMSHILSQVSLIEKKNIGATVRDANLCRALGG